MTSEPSKNCSTNKTEAGEFEETERREEGRGFIVPASLSQNGHKMFSVGHWARHGPVQWLDYNESLGLRVKKMTTMLAQTGCHLMIK